MLCLITVCCPKWPPASLVTRLLVWFLRWFVMCDIISCHASPNFGVVVLLCFSSQCCVFPAAYVLHNSWQVLLTNLWEEHLNHSLVVELTRTLDTIISKNRNMEVRILFFLSWHCSLQYQVAVSNMTLLVRFVVLIILISLPCFLAADVSGGDRLIPVLLGVFLSRRTPKVNIRTF